MKRNPNDLNDFVNEKPYKDIDQQREERDIPSGDPDWTKKVIDSGLASEVLDASEEDWPIGGQYYLNQPKPTE